MATTGYADVFGRTVANGLGSAASGQAYTLGGVATQFSVAPGTASIAPSVLGNPMGIVDAGSGLFQDITGRVALGAIPATNLATVGFVAKANTVANCYLGTMMVATGGAVSLRFSKLVAGGLVTLSTTAVSGLTYVANTFYNLRFQAYWSRLLQANVLSMKLWAVGATEPGGWMATFSTDASFTDYTAGQQAGLYARDESSVLGTITAKFQAVTLLSYGLPMPATSDPMCYDPALAYPKQTALKSLADAADTAVSALDPLASLAGLFPRVRVSLSNKIIPAGTITLSYDTTEFNIGTSTNLSYDATSLYLPVGIWMATFEIKLVQSPSDFIELHLFASGNASIFDDMRANPVHTGDSGVGGTAHVSGVFVSTDPTTPKKVGAVWFPNNTAFNYTITYMALSAIKVSDYFT
jgi:hypothetical protein